MTKRELMQIYYLNREIMTDTEELVGLKIKLRECKGSAWVREKEEIIKDRERQIIEKVRACAKLKRQIYKFIAEIDDSLTRQIFEFRYMKCMSWKQVAYMTGGYMSEDAVRKMAERYLKKVNLKENLQNG